MFENAKEIQRLWKPEIGDRVWFTDFDERNKKDIGEMILYDITENYDCYDKIWYNIDFYSIKENCKRATRNYKTLNKIKSCCVWLPSQEQMWNKIFKFLETTKEKTLLEWEKHLNYLKNWFGDEYNTGLFTSCGYEKIFDEDKEKFSLNDLLLMYYYNLLYDKFWNGKKWVKEV